MDHASSLLLLKIMRRPVTTRILDDNSILNIKTIRGHVEVLDDHARSRINQQNPILRTNTINSYTALIRGECRSASPITLNDDGIVRIATARNLGASEMKFPRECITAPKVDSGTGPRSK